LITGIAVAGFGAGALITAPVANRLIDPSDVSATFLPLGLAYLVATLLGGAFFRNPPEGYTVPGFEPSAASGIATGDSYDLSQALRSPQWYRLTGILTLNVTAGIALVSQAAPAAVSIAGMSAASAAGLVGILGIFNGAGRVLWGWGSDHMGRMPAFVTMFAIQVACFALLPSAGSAAVFSTIAALVYLCYGGGFGTMPAAAADFFGPKNAGAIYGAMIVAWSLGGVVGPLAIAAIVDRTGGFSTPFYLIAGLAAVSVVLPLTTRKPGM
jgi:OFA family oxalate/formate antiporter-like MFS transporter